MFKQDSTHEHMSKTVQGQSQTPLEYYFHRDDTLLNRPPDTQSEFTVPPHHEFYQQPPHSLGINASTRTSNTQAATSNDTSDSSSSGDDHNWEEELLRQEEQLIRNPRTKKQRETPLVILRRWLSQLVLFVITAAIAATPGTVCVLIEGIRKSITDNEAIAARQGRNLDEDDERNPPTVGCYLWNVNLSWWSLFLLLSMAAYLVSALATSLFMLLVRSYRPLARRILYYVSTLAFSLKFSLWMILSYIAWRTIFGDTAVILEVEDVALSPWISRPVTSIPNNIPGFIQNGLICAIITGVFWIFKDVIVRVLAIKFHRTAYSSRIWQAMFTEHVLFQLMDEPTVKPSKVAHKLLENTTSILGSITGPSKSHPIPRLQGSRPTAEDLVRQSPLGSPAHSINSQSPSLARDVSDEERNSRPAGIPIRIQDQNGDTTDFHSDSPTDPASGKSTWRRRIYKRPERSPLGSPDGDEKRPKTNPSKDSYRSYSRRITRLLSRTDANVEADIMKASLKKAKIEILNDEIRSRHLSDYRLAQFIAFLTDNPYYTLHAKEIEDAKESYKSRSVHKHSHDTVTKRGFFRSKMKSPHLEAHSHLPTSSRNKVGTAERNLVEKTAAQKARTNSSRPSRIRAQATRALARRLFYKIKEDKAHDIVKDDFLPYFPLDILDDAFRVFDVNRDGSLNYREFLSTVHSISKERKQLSDTLTDAEKAIAKLDTAFVLLMFAILTIIYALVLFQLDVESVLVTLSSILVAAGFALGPTTKALVESVVFLFVAHPFDIGDRVLLGEEAVVHTVHRMNLMNTSFRRFDNAQVYYSNTELNKMLIVNLRRSPEMVDVIDMAVSYQTRNSLLKHFQERILAYIERTSVHYQPHAEVYFKEAEDSNKLLIQVWVQHRHNFADMKRFRMRRSRMVLKIRSILEDLGIAYALPPQRIHLNNAEPILSSIGQQLHPRGPDTDDEDPYEGHRRHPHRRRHRRERGLTPEPVGPSVSFAPHGQSPSASPRQPPQQTRPDPSAGHYLPAENTRVATGTRIPESLGPSTNLRHRTGMTTPVQALALAQAHAQAVSEGDSSSPTPMATSVHDTRATEEFPAPLTRQSTGLTEDTAVTSGSLFSPGTPTETTGPGGRPRNMDWVGPSEGSLFDTIYQDPRHGEQNR